MAKKQDGFSHVVAAQIGDHPITLDPIEPTREVPMEVRRVESTIPAGFRSLWLTAEEEDGSAHELLSTAGWGGSWLVFHYRPKDGEEKDYVVEMTEVMTALIENARK